MNVRSASHLEANDQYLFPSPAGSGRPGSGQRHELGKVVTPRVFHPVRQQHNALVCDVGEVNVLANPGRGVTVMKTDEDNVIGFGINQTLTVESEKGKTDEVKALKKDRVPRATKGRVVFSRKEKVVRVVLPPPTVPTLPAPEGKGDAPKSETKD